MRILFPMVAQALVVTVAGVTVVFLFLLLLMAGIRALAGLSARLERRPARELGGEAVGTGGSATEERRRVAAAAAVGVLKSAPRSADGG